MSAQKKKYVKKAKKAAKKNKPESYNKAHLYIGLIIILGLTYFVFSPILNNGFTNWDDPKYIIDNPIIRVFDWDRVKRIFTEVYFSNYQPLHLFSYALEYSYFGLDPKGYHAVSLVMHLVNSLIVVWLVKLLSKNIYVGLFAGLMFGISPMHVESVAWAAERKDLLYAMFLFLSCIFYIKYIKEKLSLKFFLLAFLMYTLSIFSKAMAASLPPVLILLDVYYKRKFEWRLVLEKIPFFALALILGMVSYGASKESESIDSSGLYTFIDRIFFASHNLLTYYFKLLVPINQSAFYAYPDKVDGALPFQYYAAFVLALIFIGLVIYSLKYGRKIFTGIFFFNITIFLVLMLIPVGPTIFSERYTYIPSVGLYFILGTGLLYLYNEKSKQMSWLKPAVITLLLFVTIWHSYACYERNKVWENSGTLWTNVLEQFPDVALAMNNRGNYYGKELGQVDKALPDYERAIAINPEYAKAYCNRGIVYSIKGQFDKAIPDYNKAIALEKDYYEAISNRGIVYAQMNRFDEAIKDFDHALSLQDEDATMYHNRGTTLLQMKQFEKALQDYNTAIRIYPTYKDAFYRRSMTYYYMQNYNQAYVDFQTAVKLGFKADQNYTNLLMQALQN